MRALAAVLLVALAACSRTATSSLPEPVAAQLRGIYVLYVEPVQASAESEYATEELRRFLAESGRFLLTHDVDAAHAIVRTTISFSRPDLTEESRAVDPELGSFRHSSFSAPPTGTLRVSPVATPDSVIWTWSYVRAQRTRSRQGYEPQIIVRNVVANLSARFRRASSTTVQ